METSSPNNHPHKHYSPVSFLAGLVIALAVFFIIYKLVPHGGDAPKNTQVVEQAKPPQPVSPIKKDSLDFREEHFHKSYHHRHIDEDAEDIVVAPNEASALEKGNLSGQQKQLLELLPNAPVIYIFDMKVTDYQNLYFTMGEPLVLKNEKVAGQLLHDGLKDFSERKFIACFNKMTILSLANKTDVNALFYGGMAAYYQKDLTEALLRFEKVIRSKNNIFKQEASWFMAMALFENNSKQEAKKLLEEIVNTRGFYTQRASSLLKQL